MKTSYSLLLLISLFLYSPIKSYATIEDFSTLDSSKWQVYGNTDSVYVDSGILKIEPPSGIYSSYVRSASSIVPDDGDYQIDIRAAYTRLHYAGSGIVFGDSNPDYPVHVSNPVDSRIFTIWQDARDPLFGVFDIVSNRQFFNINPVQTSDFHDYRITYVSGTFSFYFDGTLKYSNDSMRRIKHVWFGNPGPADNIRPWNHISIDFIKVTDSISTRLTLLSDWSDDNDQLPIDRTAQIAVTGEPNAEVQASIISGSGVLSDLSMLTDGSGKAVFVLSPESLGDLKVRFTQGSAESEIVFNVYRPPIVVIPGHGGSFNGKEMLSGEVSSNWHWFTNVALSGWDSVLKVLEQNGYVEDESYKIAFYDWRQKLGTEQPQAVERFVKPVIDALLADRVEGQKVTLLAHSFGGLVSRTLLEDNNYADKVNRLMTFGTPHRGSANAFYGWEGGEAAPIGDAFYRSSVFMTNHIVARLLGHPNRAQALRATMPSVQELLPVFSPYLYKPSLPGFFPTDSLTVGKNPFLEQTLTISNFLSHVNTHNIAYDNIVGATKDSIGVIHLTDSNLTTQWEDGKPLKTFETVLGDNTIEAQYVSLGNAYDSYVQQDHGNLPDASQALIRDRLKLNSYVPVEKKMPTSIIGILLLSPAYAEIYDSTGNKVSESFDLEDNEHSYVYVTDPKPETYELRIKGTANGNYELYGNYAASQVYDELNFQNTITEGETQTYPLLISDTASGLSQVIDTSFSWPIGNVAIRRNVPYSTIQIAIPQNFSTTQLKLDSILINKTSLNVTKYSYLNKAKRLELELKTLDLFRALEYQLGRKEVSVIISGEEFSLRARGSIVVPASLRKWFAQ